MLILLIFILSMDAIAFGFGLFQALAPDQFLRWRAHRVSRDKAHNRKLLIEIAEATDRHVLQSGTREHPGANGSGRKRIRIIGLMLCLSSVVSGAGFSAWLRAK
jgi:hypothetical protein